MRKNDSSYERLLTVSLPEELHIELQGYSRRFGFSNFSALIRYALENFDAKKHLTGPESSRQVSFRIPDNLRAALDKQAKKSGVSLGHLIRTALEKRPEKPAQQTREPVKTKAAVKSPKKAPAAKKPAPKKTPTAKAKTAKAAPKKKPATKAVAKKAPTKGRK